jgi:hypothetical protein
MPYAFNLPRGYLSYSAIMLWLRSPEQYRRRYYENEKERDSVPMVFGKKIAQTLEKRDFKRYPALKKIPFYPVSEHPLEVMVEGCLVKAYLDLWTPETFTFGEVKTGSVSHVNGPPWDKVKVAKHEQLPFYSFLIKETYGKVDPKVNLIWMETRYKMTRNRVGSRILEGESRDLELTGRMEIFERRIAEWERKRMRMLILDSARDISKDYTEWLNRAV